MNRLGGRPVRLDGRGCRGGPGCRSRASRCRLRNGSSESAQSAGLSCDERAITASAFGFTTMAGCWLIQAEPQLKRLAGCGRMADLWVKGAVELG